MKPFYMLAIGFVAMIIFGSLFLLLGESVNIHNAFYGVPR